MHQLPRLERCHASETDSRAEPLAQTPRGVRAIIAVAKYLWGVVINLLEAARRWQRDDAGLLASCVAYYATVSLFPLLMVLIAGLGVFLRFTHLGQNAEQYVVAAIAQETTSEVAGQVAAAFEQVEHHALLSGPWEVVGLVIAAIAVFSQFDHALDRIWSVEQPPMDGYVAVVWRLISHRVRAFIVLLCLGFVVVMIFVAGITLDGLSEMSRERFPITAGLWRVVEVAVSVVLNTLVFTAIYRWLSKVPVGWLHAARGGLLAAITWEVGRLVLAAFLIGARYNAYGVVGSLLAAMLWAYYASSVLFLGAEYVQVIREQRMLRGELGNANENASRPLTVAQRSWDHWTKQTSRRRAA